MFEIFSKTYLVAILTIIVSFLGWLVGQDFIKSHPDWVAFIGAAVGVLNMIIRYFTSGAITILGFRKARK